MFSKDNVSMIGKNSVIVREMSADVIRVSVDVQGY